MTGSRSNSGFSGAALCLAISMGFGGIEAASAADLSGRWVGYYGCESSTKNPMILDISGNSADVQVPLGIVKVGAAISNDDIELKIQEWVTRAPIPTNTITGIAGRYLEAADVLTGEVQGTGNVLCRQTTGRAGEIQQSFPAFIASKAGPIPQARENPNGLLFKVTDDVRSGRELSQQQCSRYADFLQAGETVAIAGTLNVKAHSAVLNDELMLDVLGRDLNSWTQADFPRYRAIARACKNVMLQSGDADMIQQASAIFQWNASPLNLDPARAHARWLGPIAGLYYADIVDPLPVVAKRIEEGLYDAAPAVVAAAPATGINGFWHGYYQCGQNEYYLRLDLASSGGQIDGSFEFSSGMESINSRGVLQMSGTESADGQFEIQPGDWVQRASGVIPIGFEGSRSGDRMNGRVTQSNNFCTTFSARRLLIEPLPKNPDGLLFKVANRYQVKLEPADCRRYAEWLASGEQLQIHTKHINSVALDQAKANDVLGKSATNWGEDDHGTFSAIAQYCAQQIRQSTDAVDQELAGQITDWRPRPFSAGKFNYMLYDWLLVDQIVLVRTEAEELAAGQVGQIAQLPPTLESLDTVNGMIASLDKKEGRFKFMSVDRLTEHRETLLGEREAFGGEVAVALAAAYSNYPQNFEGFTQMTATNEQQQQGLSDRGVPNAAGALAGLYDAEATKRGQALWPEMMVVHSGKLSGELADADYGKAEALFAIDAERIRLEKYWVPSSNDSIYGDYQSYLQLRDETARNMVSRSQGKLASWIGTMPVSQTANAYVYNFVLYTFRTARLPSGYPQIQNSIELQTLAYNPEKFIRDDITTALLNGMFGEVKYQGIEFVAYIWTMWEELKSQCPAVIEQVPEYEAQAINRLMTAAIFDAEKRLLTGKVEDTAEAKRAISVLIAGLTEPAVGCTKTIDMWGEFTECWTEEQIDSVWNRILKSYDADRDMERLVANGCDDKPAKFVKRLAKFSQMSPYTNPPQPVTIQSPSEYVARN